MFKLPRNDARYHWTQHVVRKMMHYGLSADRVKRVIRAPKRMEEGIAEGTLAAMSPYGRSREARQPGKPHWKGEIWTMYASRGNKKVIITAWRYPGVSPVRDQVPIPADILAELRESGMLSGNV